MIAMEQELLFAEINFTQHWYSGNIVSTHSYETTLRLYMLAYSMVLSKQNKALM